MALVSLNFTVVDGKDQESVVTLYSSDTFTLVQLSGAVLVMGPLIKNLIKGGIKSASLSIDVDLSSIVGIGIPDPIADTEEGAIFIWKTSTGNYEKRNRLPTFSEDFIIAGTREVDRTALEVVAFNNAIIAGVTAGGATVLFSDSRNVDLGPLQAAYESFQGSRKRG